MTNGLSPLRLPVHTESGHFLGSVVDVSIDPGSHLVTVFHVKPSRLVPDVVWSPLLIHRDQVISLDEKGLVVEDAVTRSKQASASPLPTN